MADIFGSANDDFISGTAEADFIRGLEGNDVVNGGGGDDVIHGDEGDDQLRGNAGDDQLYGGDGNDLLRGNAGVDHYDGGSDYGLSNQGYGDRISFFDRAATSGVIADLGTGIISNDGFGNVETMVGIESLGGDTAFVDQFYGNDESNSLFGSRGDIIMGFGGDDAFLASAALAMLDGGDGTDFVQLQLASVGFIVPDTDGDGIAEESGPMPDGWFINLASGFVLDGFGNSGSIVGVEGLGGTELDDVLLGDGGDNLLLGGDGADTIRGNAGNDTLDGEGGEDSVFGNDGDDQINGGGGNDLLRGGAGIDSFDGGANDEFNFNGYGDRVSFFEVTATQGVVADLRTGIISNDGFGNVETMVGIESRGGDTAVCDTI